MGWIVGGKRGGCSLGLRRKGGILRWRRCDSRRELFARLVGLLLGGLVRVSLGEDLRVEERFRYFVNLIM